MERPQRKRVMRRATVVSSEWLSPSMVRVVFTGADLEVMRDLPYTDHYVKMLFPPAGAPYAWPFDPEQVKAERAPEHWPVTRTYTVRSYDELTSTMPSTSSSTATRASPAPGPAGCSPGAEIGFYGPGGAFAPDLAADAHLMIGDEAALPAIAASLERLDRDGRGARVPRDRGGRLPPARRRPRRPPAHLGGRAATVRTARRWPRRSARPGSPRGA